MKNLMKNKIFIGCTAGILIVAVIITVILLLPDRPQIGTPDSASDTSDVTVNIPKISETSKTQDTQGEESKPTENLLPDVVMDVGEGQQNDLQVGDQNGSKQEPEKPAAPIVTDKPKEDTGTNNNIGGIQVGSDSGEYNCGSPNHKCNNADAHAYIQNLELEGCPLCSSHTCASFYAKDEWGFTKYNQKLCPKYSEQNDPAKFCQKCGREMWSQSNPTGCFSYLQDTDCECGEHVKGNTCHHH